MSSKYTQECLGSYTKDIRVKISERYKPPLKINLMSYSQRLYLNEQIRHDLPTYKFTLEESVINRIKAWRSARSLVFEEIKNRLETALKFNMEQDEKERYQIENMAKENRKGEIDCSNGNSVCPDHSEEMMNSKYAAISSSDSLRNTSQSNMVYNAATCLSSSNVLIPTQVFIPSSNILTPIPLKNQNYDIKPIDRSPFNISDFEADTSSPFDNMELKSINDMEELARVLKTDDTHKDNTTSFYSSYHYPIASDTNNQTNYSNCLSTGNQYNYNNISSDITYFKSDPISMMGKVNGLYYKNNESIPNMQTFNTTYPLLPTNNVSNITVKDSAVLDDKTCYQTNSNILESIEINLDNTHLDVSSYSKANNGQLHDGKCVTTVGGVQQPKLTANLEEMDEPFHSLPKNLQDLSKSISSMGFPLSMVARTCENIGNDHKKVLEHVLAMSELIDLGFSEKDASRALLACNNNKDQALDKLIS